MLRRNLLHITGLAGIGGIIALLVLWAASLFYEARATRWIASAPLARLNSSASGPMAYGARSLSIREGLLWFSLSVTQTPGWEWSLHPVRFRENHWGLTWVGMRPGTGRIGMPIWMPLLASLAITAWIRHKDATRRCLRAGMRARWTPRQFIPDWICTLATWLAFVGLISMTPIFLAITELIAEKLGLTDRNVSSIFAKTFRVAMFLLGLGLSVLGARKISYYLKWTIVPEEPTACLYCSYNLTGNTSGRCPECGNPLPQPQNPPSQPPIPG